MWVMDEKKHYNNHTFDDYGQISFVNSYFI